MIPIIPKWDISAVVNWEDLWIHGGAGESELSPACAVLLNFMAMVGIARLTEENADSVWRRIAVHQALFGTFVTDDVTAKPLFLTRSDVIRHIGAEVEAETLSSEEFCVRVFHHRLCVDDEKLPFYIANGNCSLSDLSGPEARP